MIETLVGLADKLPDVNTRRGMLASVMRDTVATITSPAAGLVLRSPTDLLVYLEQCLGDSDKLTLLVDFKQAIISFVGIIAEYVQIYPSRTSNHLLVCLVRGMSPSRCSDTARRDVVRGHRSALLELRSVAGLYCLWAVMEGCTARDLWYIELRFGCE